MCPGEPSNPVSGKSHSSAIIAVLGVQGIKQPGCHTGQHPGCLSVPQLPRVGFPEFCRRWNPAARCDGASHVASSASWPAIVLVQSFTVAICGNDGLRLNRLQVTNRCVNTDRAGRLPAFSRGRLAERQSNRIYTRVSRCHCLGKHLAWVRPPHLPSSLYPQLPRFAMSGARMLCDLLVCGFRGLTKERLPCPPR